MKRRIVIIGGMGPQASLELHQRIIACAAKAGAKDNEDYPEILHASIPITDFISSGNTKAGLQQLIKSLDALQFQKDDQVIVACNTVHILLPELEARYNIKFESLIEVTTQTIEQNAVKLIGLLASPTTIKTKLYEIPLNEIGCKVLLPTDREVDELEKAIRSVIANEVSNKAYSLVEPIIGRMRREGAEQIILGCTELSVIFSKHSTSYLIDPINAACKQLTNNF